MFRRERRAPCKLNNVRETRSTKRTRQVVHEALKLCGATFFFFEFLKVNDLTINENDLNNESCLDTILLRV